jgi:isoleucyl-tRNA synthetase
VIKVRQPLARALVGAPGFAGLPGELRAQVAEELNVRVIEPLEAVGDRLVDYTVKPNFRALGRRFGSGTQAVAAAIGAADPAAVAAALRSGQGVPVQVDGAAVELGPDDVIVTQTPRSGWAVAADGGETVALKVAITPELRREGLARDVIRLVQEARKNDGLAVSDRIWLRWATADPQFAEALTEHGQMISAEVLATDYGQAPAAGMPSEGSEHGDTELGLSFWLGPA